MPSVPKRPPYCLDRLNFILNQLFSFHFVLFNVCKTMLIQTVLRPIQRKRFLTRWSRKLHLWCFPFRSETTKAFPIDFHCNVPVYTGFTGIGWHLSNHPFERSIQVLSINDPKSICWWLSFRATDGQTRWPPFPHKISSQLPKNTNCLISTDKILQVSDNPFFNPFQCLKVFNRQYKRFLLFQLLSSNQETQICKH